MVIGKYTCFCFNVQDSVRTWLGLGCQDFFKEMLGFVTVCSGFSCEDFMELVEVL